MPTDTNREVIFSAVGSWRSWTESDQDLLDSAAQRLDRDAETLMQRYYGCPEDGRQELEEFNRTGKLQPSFAQLLRHELQVIQASAE
jgi:hypothetical protein